MLNQEKNNKEIEQLIDDILLIRNIENMSVENFRNFCKNIVTLLQQDIEVHIITAERIENDYLSMGFDYVESSSYQREKEIETEFKRLKEQVISIMKEQDISKARKEIISLFYCENSNKELETIVNYTAEYNTNNTEQLTDQRVFKTLQKKYSKFTIK